MEKKKSIMATIQGRNKPRDNSNRGKQRKNRKQTRHTGKMGWRQESRICKMGNQREIQEMVE